MPSGGVCGVLSIMPRIWTAACSAAAGVSATSPLGTATPNSRSSALAWYSWIFTRDRSQDQRHRLELAADRIERQAERLEGQSAEQCRVTFFTEDHVGDTDVVAKLEQGAALAADDRRTVRETERLTLEWPDLQPTQHRSGGDRVHGTRINGELEPLPRIRLGDVGTLDEERRDSHGDRPPR